MENDIVNFTYDNNGTSICSISPQLLNPNYVLKRKDDALCYYYNDNKNEYIDKEKICKALKIESKIKDEALISLIETIFKECERLEDIENKKIQNAYENVFNEGAKSVKDKLNNLLNEYANVKIDNSAKIIEFYQKIKELSKGEE